MLSVLLTAVISLTVFISLELTAKFYWASRWQQRSIYGFTNTFPNVLIRGLFVVGVGVASYTVLGDVSLSSALASSTWLILVSLATDITSMKIAKEPCWIVAGLNALFLLTDYSLFRMLSAATAFLIIGFALIVTALLSKGGLGSGDLRLMLALSLLGGWFGFTAILVGLMFGSLIQIPVRMVMKSRNKTLKAFPFAPSLIVGLILGVIFFGSLNSPLTDWAGIF